jgi:hypothetical protein
VRDAIAPRLRVSPETTRHEGDGFTNVYYEVDEGYGWRRISVRSGERRYAAYHSNGNGGQVPLVSPEFDFAVMLAAGNPAWVSGISSATPLSAKLSFLR